MRRETKPQLVLVPGQNFEAELAKYDGQNIFRTMPAYFVVSLDQNSADKTDDLIRSRIGLSLMRGSCIMRGDPLIHESFIGVESQHVERLRQEFQFVPFETFREAGEHLARLAVQLHLLPAQRLNRTVSQPA